MAENMFTTGGPARLPVFFLTATFGLAGLVACSGEVDSTSETDTAQVSGFLDEGQQEPATASGFGEGFDAGGKLLWNTPDLPEGIEMSVSGTPVDYNIVEGFLLPKWSEYASSLPLETPEAELIAGFFQDQEEVFYELVRGVLLLTEAELRFPELDEHELEHFRERMEGAAGTAKDTLVARYGADGWAAHVERRFRLQLILDEYQQYAPEVTEEELYDFYDSEILANLPEPEKREHIDISFKAMEPTLRANLMKGRAVDAQEAWLDEQVVGVKVAVKLPAGLSHNWTITEPR